MIEAELFVALTSLHFSILFWLELQGTLQYAEFAQEKEQNTLKTRKVERQPHMLVISTDPKKKKVACRASYNASPKKKRAASRASGLLTAYSSI